MTAIVVFAHRRRLFSPAYEYMDQAANSLLMRDSLSMGMFHGNYSRVGFNHPGPIFLWIQAAFELVFYRITGLLATPYNAHILGAIVIAAGFLSVTAARLARSEGTGAAIAFVALVLFAHVLQPGLFSYDWLPNLYLGPFALFTLAFADSLRGRRAGRALAISTGFLVHGHVMFLGLCGGPLLFLAVRRIRKSGWMFWREATENSARTTDRFAVSTIAAIFFAPLIIDVGLLGTSNWRHVFAFRHAPKAPRSLWDSMQFLAKVLTFSQPMLIPVLVAGIVLGLVMIHRHGWRGAWLWTVVAVVVPGFGYAHFGVDEQTYLYTVLFLVAAAIIFAAVLLNRVFVTRSIAIRSSTTLAVLATLSLLLPLAPIESGAAWIPRADAAVSAAAHGRSVRLLGQNDWAGTVALLVRLEREGKPACVVTKPLAVLVTPQRICGPDDGQSLTILVGTSKDASAGKVLFNEDDTLFIETKIENGSVSRGPATSL
jgi:hypothetical protein